MTSGSEKRSELAALLDRVVAHLSRFIVFPSTLEADTVALWIAQTHAIEAVYATLYLYVESPQPRCGKSTLFEVIEQLVARPETASNMTPAAMFRVIEAEQPTLLLDEIDAQFREDKEAAGRFGPFSILATDGGRPRR